MLYELVLFSGLLGIGLGCSCVPGSFDKSRSTVICENFRNVDNIYIGVVQEIYCKCLISTEQPEDFSCVKYDMAGGSRNAETQETFNCENQDESINYERWFQRCATVSEEIFGLLAPSVNLRKTPVTNLTDEMDCGFSNDEYDVNGGSGCDLNAQPCYYTVNVTRVYKGNLTVGSLISSAGPDVLTSCGQNNRVLKLGLQYLVGVGGACTSLVSWSELAEYESADLDLLQRATDNPEVCDSAAAIAYSGTVLLLVALLAMTF